MGCSVTSWDYLYVMYCDENNECSNTFAVITGSFRPPGLPSSATSVADGAASAARNVPGPGGGVWRVQPSYAGHRNLLTVRFHRNSRQAPLSSSAVRC
eukprot:3643333-Rhodomonas_salina.1